MSWNGQIAASHSEDPFGKPIRANGTMAKVNPFRFDTKYTDNESGLLYYGHRYLNPSTGRWLSRAPIGEQGRIMAAVWGRSLHFQWMSWLY